MNKLEPSVDDTKIVVMAVIGKPYGIKGFNRLNVFAEDPATLEKHSNYFIKQSNQDWRPLTFKEMKNHHANLVVKIDGTDTPESAKQWTHGLVGILKSDLPQLENDNYYYHQLLGLTVYNTQNKNLGQITDIWSNGAHDVFEVKENEKARVLPYTNKVIIKVCLESKSMQVDWKDEY